MRLSPSCTIAGFIGALLVPASALGQTAPVSGGEPWYKVVTGIIAIPAAVIALVISLKMIRKTSLESRKLELEIQEKQDLATKSISDTPTLRGLIEPVGDSQRALILLVRFVVLDLAVRLWDIVPSAVTYLTNKAPAALLLSRAMVSNAAPGRGWMIGVVTGQAVISLLFEIVYWVIVFGFGWPLFKDTCRYLNIPIGGILDLPFIRWKNQSG
jgi:hypothetical protein